VTVVGHRGYYIGIQPRSDSDIGEAHNYARAVSVAARANGVLRPVDE
jgi:hypothetical protein